MQASATSQSLPPNSPSTISSPAKYLIFHLDEEEFGTEVLRVLEIMGLQDITSVPGVPAYVKGVINLRGKVIPVVDLRLKFSMPPSQYVDRTCIVVVRTRQENEESMVGLIVDGVDEVLSLAPSEIEEPPDFGPGVETLYVTGIAKVAGGVKILLDIDYILNSEELSGITALLH